MPTPQRHAQHNQLLARLPRREQAVLRPHLGLVSLHTKEEIDHIGSPLRHIDFPITAAISLLGMQPPGHSVEVAVIGHEGCTSSYVLAGLKRSPCRTLVQVGGLAFRLNVSTLRSLLPDVPVFERMVGRFSAVLFRHVVVSVGCSQFHSVQQRLGRWLLAHRHRTGLTHFPFTHDFLAEQLGAQRVTVTQTLAHLQDKGLVRYRYGKVELLSIRGMKGIACECFQQAVRAIEEYLKEIKTYSQG